MNEIRIPVCARRTLKRLVAVAFLACSFVVSNAASAATFIPSPNVYQINEGVAFSLGNSGASHYLFGWNDTSGSFSGIEDPTLVLTVGQTYTFQRTSGSHPFVITNDSLPVTGTDGSFARTTTSGPVIDAATLTPLADFTADPSPTSDLISWTPTTAEIGDYFYTCRVTGHTGMTGAIQVVAVPEPASGAFVAVTIAGWAMRRRRRS